MAGPVEALQTAIRYTFRDAGLLERALTHRSLSFDHVSKGRAAVADNEQFEFLGDAVLGFIVSEHLVATCPDATEGHLSKRKSLLVSAAHLYRAAQRLDLGRFLFLGRCEELGGGRVKKGLLSDGIEALLAAVYLDGGMEAARAFVHAFVLDDMGDIEHADPNDYKTALQERTQSLHLPLPRYVTLAESGPEHNKTFTIEVRVGTLTALANGPSKKAAGQRAARLMLEMLENSGRQVMGAAPGGSGLGDIQT